MNENKYYAVYEDLKFKIKKREYKEYSKIPSENQLCDLYGCSRATIRKSLELLSIFGFIDRSQGKQTIVANNKNWGKKLLTEEEYKQLLLFDMTKEEIAEIKVLSEKYSSLKKIINFWKHENLI
ncbi:GntR family transcriptional regulator [Enterococcus hirae]